jgi:hypothetical protein
MADERRRAVDNSSIIRQNGLFAITNGMIEDVSESQEAVIPENALVKREDGTFAYKQFVLNAASLTIPEGTDEDGWKDIGGILLNLESALAWWVGDWAAYANCTWGATAKQIAAIFEYEQSTIEAYMSVAKSVPGMIRNHTVSFSHHRLVMKLSEAEQFTWIAAAARQGWTLAEMREAMKGDDTRPPRLMPEAIKEDWNFLRSMEERKRSPEERNQAQIKIDRIRQTLDEVERKLWEG